MDAASLTIIESQPRYAVQDVAKERALRANRPLLLQATAAKDWD